MNEEFKLKK